ncbi:MAG: hypothetical protein K6D02_07210 [Lachnospiraceae bacterium]|nr:hypothetical protein [Lachnospiraceae bacterium]
MRRFRGYKVQVLLLATVLGFSMTLSGCAKKDKSKDVAEVELSKTASPSPTVEGDEEEAEETPSASASASSEAQSTSSATTSTEKSTTSETDEIETKESVDGSGINDGTLKNAMGYLLGWGHSAGSGLKATEASVKLISWSNKYGVSGVSSSALNAAIKDVYNTYNDDNKENFKENLADVIAVGDNVIKDADGMKDDLESAGVYDEAKSQIGKKNTIRNWTALKGALSASCK